MQVLVATKELQGQRKNDFNFCDDGELVGFTFECDRETVDGPCGCRRSLSGLKSMKGTTTFKVVDLPDMTIEKFRAELRASKEAGGWLKSLSEKDIADWVNSEVDELARVANMFTVGRVVEKRGRSILCRLPKVKKPRKRRPVPLVKQPHESDLRFG
jgi:hypothetical protein